MLSQVWLLLRNSVRWSWTSNPETLSDLDKSGFRGTEAWLEGNGEWKRAGKWDGAREIPQNSPRELFFLFVFKFKMGGTRADKTCYWAPESVGLGWKTLQKFPWVCQINISLVQSLFSICFSHSLFEIWPKDFQNKCVPCIQFDSFRSVDKIWLRAQLCTNINISDIQFPVALISYFLQCYKSFSF